MVDIKKKRDFLREFMAKHNTQTKEERWLLTYLVESEYKLNKIKFVAKLPPKLNGFKVSAENMANGKFFAIIDGQKLDVPALFKYIHNSLDKDIYFELDFIGKFSNADYLNLIEEAEDIEDDTTDLPEEIINSLDGVLEEAGIVSYAATLRDRIDEALDNRNEALFMLLSAELNKLIAEHEFLQ